MKLHLIWFDLIDYEDSYCVSEIYLEWFKNLSPNNQIGLLISNSLTSMSETEIYVWNQITAIENNDYTISANSMIEWNCHKK